MRFRSFALLSVAVALTACGTDETGPTGFLPTQPTGRFRFVHAISDPARASAINVTVDGVPVGVSLVYAGQAYMTCRSGWRGDVVSRLWATSAAVSARGHELRLLDAPFRCRQC